MDCPHCKTSNPLGAANCSTCRAPLAASAATVVGVLTPPVGSGQVTIVDAAAGPPYKPSEATLDGLASSPMDIPTAWSVPPAAQSLEEARASLAPLKTGSLLGNRYEIVSILGEGGMGAVYKARDVELDRMVALKVIRPELAGRPEILQRFKQELILARKVTHRNVIRIFDLGEAAGIKFITMEFIEGRDLKSILAQDGKLPPDRAVEIIQQVCLALEAAHSEGVVHRDLKPQNIMVDQQGRASVMDFGIARSLEFGGMTQTGALVGTPEYMSPEQVRGEHADARSDLFTLGIIFQELLTGVLPYQAETAMASMFKRTRERAASVHHFNPEVPPHLGEIVAKCLEMDTRDRFQTAREVYDALEAWESGTAAPIGARGMRWARRALRNRKAIGYAAAAAILVVTGGIALRRKLTFLPLGGSTVAPANVQSLAIVAFRNASGNTSLDWLGPSLADMLSTDVGQSASLRTVSPDHLHQILSDLHIAPSTTIDSAMVANIAEFSNADTVVWGQYAKFGDQIRIDATLLDIKHNRSVPMKIEAASEKEIPATIDGLADLIRKNLAVSPDVMKELKASSFQPTSKSVPAMRAYNQGLEYQRDGRNVEAEKFFEAATKEDPTFALAFSRLAQTYSSLGYDNQAEQAAQDAVTRSQNLPEAERYLIAAIRAQITRNLPGAIKAYDSLAKTSPGNTDVQSALAALYEQSGDLAKASQYNDAILKANPKNITAMLAAGRLDVKLGKPEVSLDSLNRALTLSVQLDNQEQKADSLDLIGSAYSQMNKPQEALRYYQEELTIWKQLGQKRGMAHSLNWIANAQDLLGDNKSALQNYQQALAIRREIGDKQGVGDTLIDAGDFYAEHGDRDQALKMFKEALQIERDIGNQELQATCLNNIGAAYFEKAQYEDARAYYQQALQLHEKANVPQDIALSVYNLAETSTRLGEFDQAISQYMHALDLSRSVGDTRSAAMYSYALGMIFDNQGRYGAAINSKQGALKTFQDLKDKTTWMVEVGGGYGESLTLAGRGEEAKPYLSDALSLGRELKNDGLVSLVLAFQGDAAYYRGDTKSARPLYEQALQAATSSKEPDRILIAKVALAKISAQEGPAQPAISSLKQLMQQADESGLQNTSVECSLAIADAMIRSHDTAHARQELERALPRADKIGLKPLSAAAHYLLGNALRASGNQADAMQDYRNVIQILDGMRQETGAEKILQRADFKAMYEEATRWSQSGKG
jgi:eukaryotic-like serine/threonine-protein kinase